MYSTSLLGRKYRLGMICCFEDQSSTDKELLKGNWFQIKPNVSCFQKMSYEVAVCSSYSFECLCVGSFLV